MSRVTTGLIFACLFFALTASSDAQQTGNAQQSSVQDQLEILIKEAISVAGNLKEGSIRSEVERDFVLDGGLQFGRRTARYMFKKCHFIKITVEYSLEEKAGNWIDGSPNDRVVSVSKPYLEYPFMD
jgi:hypothetical protein